MISCKRGVKLDGLRSEMSLVLPVVAYAYASFGQDCIITSGTEGDPSDGVHSALSKHYTGEALDFRTRMFRQAIFGYKKHEADSRIEILASLIRESLTGEYDVIVEHTHIHVEFDPS